MKKPGSFEGLMDEVYKNLYEKKNTKESKLTKLTKEIILKVKKNQSPVPNREKYALMFKHPVNKSITKTSSKTIFDKMSKIYNETVLQETPSKTKSEISTFLSTISFYPLLMLLTQLMLQFQAIRLQRCQVQ